MIEWYRDCECLYAQKVWVGMVWFGYEEKWAVDGHGMSLFECDGVDVSQYRPRVARAFVLAVSPPARHRR